VASDDPFDASSPKGTAGPDFHLDFSNAPALVTVHHPDPTIDGTYARVSSLPPELAAQSYGERVAGLHGAVSDFLRWNNERPNSDFSREQARRVFSYVTSLLKNGPNAVYNNLAEDE
jgi:hypothetical protein